MTEVFKTSLRGKRIGEGWIDGEDYYKKSWNFYKDCHSYGVKYLIIQPWNDIKDIVKRIHLIDAQGNLRYTITAEDAMRYGELVEWKGTDKGWAYSHFYRVPTGRWQRSIEK